MSSQSSKRRGVRRLVLFLVALLLGSVIIGFFTFVRHIDRLSAPDPLPDADGIVVWTGPGGGRLETAGALLESGLGERVFVSGVNPSLTEARVGELMEVSDALSACCVDVDYAALDTRGNARETALWADALGYDHVLLVTSSYHMPRAQIEIAQEMAGLRITAVPVRSDDTVRWWASRARFQRLFGEYGKYLLVLARGRGESEAAREPVLPEEGLTSAEPEPPEENE